MRVRSLVAAAGIVAAAIGARAQPVPLGVACAGEQWSTGHPGACAFATVPQTGILWIAATLEDGSRAHAWVSDPSGAVFYTDVFECDPPVCLVVFPAALDAGTPVVCHVEGVGAGTFSCWSSPGQAPAAQNNVCPLETWQAPGEDCAISFPPGGSQLWFDVNVVPGGTARYWISDDAGTHTYLGPFSCSDACVKVVQANLPANANLVCHVRGTGSGTFSCGGA